VGRGRGKHRVMTAMEFMARLSAIIAPPRYPLVRYGGVLAPRSAWRRHVVPKPRERPSECDRVRGAEGGDGERPARAQSRAERPTRQSAGESAPSAPEPRVAPSSDARKAPAVDVSSTATSPRRSGDVATLAPNVLSVLHWDRLLGGVLYAATPRGTGRRCCAGRSPSTCFSAPSAGAAYASWPSSPSGTRRAASSRTSGSLPTRLARPSARPDRRHGRRRGRWPARAPAGVRASGRYEGAARGGEGASCSRQMGRPVQHQRNPRRSLWALRCLRLRLTGVEAYDAPLATRRRANITLGSEQETLLAAESES
jgi:hypothetical protein